MFDCGVHPGFSGEQSLPYFDSIDMDTVDLMLVTHFHLDHCAAVPYVVGKTVFKVTGLVRKMSACLPILGCVSARL